MKNFFSFYKSCAWAKIFIIFASLSFILRLVFLFEERAEIDFTLLLLAKIFTIGCFFDFITLCYIAFIPLAYYTFLSSKIFYSKSHQVLLKIFYFFFLYVIVFSIFSEWFFWDEFKTRFNFIAVDYLIYTAEVIGNIVESYPMGILLTAIFAISLIIFLFSCKTIFQKNSEQNFPPRLKRFFVFFLFLSAAFFAINSSKLTEISENSYANEISANGIYQLFSAYRNNQIDFDKIYSSEKLEDAILEIRKSISSQEPHSKFLNDEDISRFIPSPKTGGEKKYNVILVVMESLSADFMKAFGGTKNITPNLDHLAENGLFFTGLKATGTRTIRGLEAIALSITPTPGNSIVRRENNENLFNISSPLQERGYESKFIYGGFGYFDNMNYFFENNGFKIVDRANFSSKEVSFANSWGVSDEDLFNKTIKEADESFAAKKPFLNFVMTSSNHRPFTYPSGRIDIDSKTGRNGAVKYADYAIGKLIKDAQNKPWFKNTIFIFVADHCAGSAGNTNVPLWRYQIPAIFYAPQIIKPQIFDKNVSQIDIAPTLFGIMNFGYKSKFFGADILNNEKTIEHRSFVSTYSEIGYFIDHRLYLLQPKKQIKFFDVKLNKYGWNGSSERETLDYEKEELKKAISYYQVASYLFKNGKLKNFNDQKN